MGTKILDFLWDKWIFLPIVLTEKSHNKTIRVFGGILYIFWFFPAMLIIFPIFFLGLIMVFFESIAEK